MNHFTSTGGQFVRGQELKIEGGSIADLIVVIELTATQQDQDTLAQRFELLCKFAQCCHRCGTNGRLLENHPVVDVANELARVLSGRSLLAQHVEHANRQRGELAVFDKLTECGERSVSALWDVVGQVENRVDDGFLVLKATLLAQHVREKVEHGTMLVWELLAEQSNRLHHHHLEFVRDLRHKMRDLLDETIHIVRVASLQQSGDRQRCNAAVAIRNQRLQVLVALRDKVRILGGHTIQCTNRREAQCRVCRTQKQGEN
mmetsp:Transcript_16169/g.48564  ORF Transcript_16169/g.48564 Transcript_16169/m.48564 type:complete len:260 (-) Transcript_16169:963-1742(-)